jgi:hypothetical protein
MGVKISVKPASYTLWSEPLLAAQSSMSREHIPSLDTYRPFSNFH